MTTNPRTIIVEVGNWVNKQPWGQPGCPHPKPEYGIIEEFGELVHALLKNDQGIRGMDDEHKFAAAVTDALGDLMVYLSHWCYVYDAFYTIQVRKLEAVGQRFHISQCLIAITQLVDASGPKIAVTQPKANSVATRVATVVSLFARSLGFDIMHDCLFPTWEKVKQRDWNKDKMQGGE